MTFKEKISHIPYSTGGITIGTIGIANAFILMLRTFHVDLDNSYKIIVPIVESIAIITTLYYIVLLTLKFIYGFNKIKRDIRNPYLSGFLGVIFLSFISISNAFAIIFNSLVTNNPTLLYNLLIVPNIINVIMILAQLVFLGIFLYYVVRKNIIERNLQIYGSWFIPLVGFSVCVAFVNYLNDIVPILFFQIIWILAFTLYCIFFPIGLYRFMFRGHKNAQHIPSMAIIASPAFMLVGGFVAAFNPNRAITSVLNNQSAYEAIILILFMISSIGLGFLLLVFIRSIKNWSNNLRFASFTFPMALTASGLFIFASSYFSSEATKVSFYTLATLGTLIFSIGLSMAIFMNIRISYYIYKLLRYGQYSD
ncbi:hypothetical protein ACJA23_00695 [Mycoplasma corogypsi]|uniref:SLAC1 family transporter n=1 Tax=Mycoplasma corogypsi TaxID=2106 RepID=UPI003872AE6A